MGEKLHWVRETEIFGWREQNYRKQQAAWMPLEILSVMYVGAEERVIENKSL